MISLHQHPATIRLPVGTFMERRAHRRHDLLLQDIPVYRDGDLSTVMLGQLVDISAGGIRIRGDVGELKPDSHVRIRIELPRYAGISPFIDRSGMELRPRQQWVGWVQVTRVHDLGDGVKEIGARLLDMDELDRGMLGLYLSTQPMAA